MAIIKLKNLLAENMRRFTTKNLNETELNEPLDPEVPNFAVGDEYKATFYGGSHLRFKITKIKMTTLDPTDPFGSDGVEGQLLGVFPEGKWVPSIGMWKYGYEDAKPGDPIRMIIYEGNEGRTEFEVWLPNTYDDHQTFSGYLTQLKKLK